LAPDGRFGKRLSLCRDRHVRGAPLGSRVTRHHRITLEVATCNCNGLHCMGLNELIAME
jgi:hypothetical protein